MPEVLPKPSISTIEQCPLILGNVVCNDLYPIPTNDVTNMVKNAKKVKILRKRIIKKKN